MRLEGHGETQKQGLVEYFQMDVRISNVILI